MILVMKIRGQVQGVGFRSHTENFAVQHKLIGFVRNLQDPNEVEIILENPPQEALKELLSYIKQTFSIESLTTKELTSFKIIH